VRLALCLLLLPAAAAGETHRLKASTGVPTFAVRPPILTVRPGDVVESESLWGEWYERAGGKWPGEVGPIAIEGAEPGDTLVVEVLKVRPNRDTAVSTQGGRFGALVPDGGTAMLNEPFPRGRYVWKLDRARMTGTLEMPASKRTVTVPLRPMLGRVAVAPEGEEAFGGLWPGRFGGNMDASDVREGSTVYLPVFHPGALFYFGDGHALQGDGEVCGSGLETSMEVAFRFGLQKKKDIAWPRIEDAEHIMVAGSARPLSDALRIAFVDLVEWLAAGYGMDRAEAYQLVSQTAVIRVANMVDPLYTVVAKFPKRLLEPQDKGAAGVRLGDVPWTEAETLLTPERVVVLPLGAGAKEHGPHLLLRNDQILADYLARRVVTARPVALLPTLTYGFYPAFLEYPGSVSLSEETQRDVVVQVCRSLARYGPRRFYVLNTGVSTARPLKAAAELLAAEGILMRFTDVTRAGRAAEDSVRQQAEGTHADEIETSMVLFMEPGAVRMERATRDGLPGRRGPLTRDAGNAQGHYSPSGVFGDATLASWEKGQRVTEGMLGDILREIDELSLAAVPAGSPRSPLEASGPAEPKP
jgi:acetamidase/formamidase/creatinine amidohydrolase/Fe(II)-dependent formamide hydrolase-like protein